jgi:hypothetical protein
VLTGAALSGLRLMACVRAHRHRRVELDFDVTTAWRWWWFRTEPPCNQDPSLKVRLCWGKVACHNNDERWFNNNNNHDM